MTNLAGKSVVVVGGSSGMGAAVAALAAAGGATVTIAGASELRLAAGLSRLPAATRTARLDLGDAASIQQFAGGIGRIDHLVVTAQSSAALRTLKPLSAVDLGDIEIAFRIKLFGMLRLIQSCLPRMAADGSIVLFSGAASRRMIPGHVGLGALNGAVESAGRQLAKELAPIRVNVISPGLVRTEAYDAMPEKDRETMFAARAKALPVGRIGRPEDIAQAVVHLLCNGYVTGVVQDIDGGGLLG